ncbi:DUF3817 domain-containing protein [Nocardioides gilvus]|uniref:DUF3817 domain-containing protein n=1 Tax=Nocardioides gilvus TaxID=1735589 RepID=UPI0019514CD5|nr:DUF3817 domain-containing protein [Nocardioides gilvus]
MSTTPTQPARSTTVTPRRFFLWISRAEAVTWALLLLGLFLKYVTETTDLAVSVFGMVHGVVFITYCLTNGLLWVDQKWKFGQLVLGVLCAIPPFLTLWFDHHAERKGLVSDRWRLRDEEPSSLLEKAAAFVIRKPLLGLVVGLVAVAVLTAVALVIGPPGGGDH